MVYFCLLWVPLFFMLRRSFSQSGSYGVWALLLGSITAIVQFFLGNIISPDGFDFSRFLFGFVDIVCVPVLLPILVYLVILIFKKFSCQIDFANFALLWLIPIGALRALSWSSTNDPILLVMTPLLWTALAVGISFFINLTVHNFKWYTAIFSFLGILLMPVLACVTYWVFFSHQNLMGYGLLIAANIPLILSLILDIRQRT
jgi:hypothetical protein